MVALVTGSHGFLGSYVERRLVADGASVVGVGRPECDIPSAAFSAVLREAKPDVLVHCAAPASVASSVKNPRVDFEGSAGVLASLLSELVQLQLAPRVLFISSAAVYGQPSLPTTESEPTTPISPYGWHRLMCEQLLREFHATYGLPTAALRVFSAYGRGLRRQLIWDMCEMAVRDGQLVLSGTGSESRDFVHASDVAAAVMAVSDAGRFEGEPYNVGTGVETTIAEAATLVADHFGLSQQAVLFSGESRPGDPRNWRADVTRLRELGFQPARNLGEGIAEVARWAGDELVAHSRREPA